jgi:hypothetical protein
MIFGLKHSTVRFQVFDDGWYVFSRGNRTALVQNEKKEEKEPKNKE